MVVAFCLPFVIPAAFPGARDALLWFAPARCERTTVVEVVAVPAVRAAVEQLGGTIEGRHLDDGSCLSVRVREQDPADTVESSIVLPPSRAPQLWVGDSSLWLAHLTRWKERTVSSFGTTPVIMVSSGTTLNSPRNRSWTSAAPGWIDLFQRAQPVSIPDVSGSVQGQLALIALWQAAGKGASADRAVAAVTISTRMPTTPQFASDGDALSAIVNPANGLDDSQAPFVVTTEQAMVAINRNSMRGVLAPLYPSEGSPFLDFPIVRLAEESQDEPHRQATNLVIAALTSSQAKAAARALGLRDPAGGQPPANRRGLPARVRRLTPPSTVDLTRFLTRFATLDAPHQMIVAMDVSTSMLVKVPGSTATRLQAATGAAIGVGEMLPPTSCVGLWAFALTMNGTKPYRELSRVAPLKAPENGVTHRDVLRRRLQSMGQLITGGGTGLYVTIVDAVRTLRADYDPRAANAVVVFTDGVNENDPRMTLGQTVTILKQEAAAAPDRPVRVVAIGMGPGADVQALQAVADATGGSAYQARTAQELEQVLFDAISRRA
ncbi:MAG TPA: hypothetical protein VI248_05565 [Kineosporiaceae bacterium]